MLLAIRKKECRLVCIRFDHSTSPGLQCCWVPFVSFFFILFLKKWTSALMPIRRGRGVLWSTNAAVAAVASCCCVVMNLCYQVSHCPFCVASSTALLKLVMLLKNHISAAIRDKYEEAARWLLYTYPSYIFSLSAGHMGSCSSTSLFFCSSTGGLEFANFDNRSAVLHRVS